MRQVGIMPVLHNNIILHKIRKLVVLFALCGYWLIAYSQHLVTVGLPLW